jgi:CRISPR system Cascade subunit CasC
MSRFIQLHILTSYPPANLNRDDLGRPKTAVLGATTRLRVSSQCLKRTWRTSDVFEAALAGNVGIRTKEMGVKINEALTTGRKLADILAGNGTAPAAAPLAPKAAKAAAQAIAAVFGKLKSAGKEEKEATAEGMTDLKIEQLAHFSPEEVEAIESVIAGVRDSGKAPEAKELEKLLGRSARAVDIAMFGRMLADKPKFNVEAAVQVAHAVSVQKVTVEEDYFTAVDDLNRGDEGMGAGHLGVNEFAAGVFYLYLCVNRDLLEANLGGDADLAGRALRALAEAAVKVAPAGKQASFASRAFASYVLAEKGAEQPRSLSVAFLKPIGGEDILGKAIESLEGTRQRMDDVYGPCAECHYAMDAHNGAGPNSGGTFKGLLDFIGG